MIRDPVVEEVREARRKTEDTRGRDWDRLTQHYREIQEQSGHPLFQGSPRTRTPGPVSPVAVPLPKDRLGE